VTLISLDDFEYLSVIEAASAIVVGNAVYDAFIARCAIKASAKTLLTWNTRHFNRLGPEIARLTKTPSEL